MYSLQLAIKQRGKISYFIEYHNVALSVNKKTIADYKISDRNKLKILNIVLQKLTGRAGKFAGTCLFSVSIKNKCFDLVIAVAMMIL